MYEDQQSGVIQALVLAQPELGPIEEVSPGGWNYLRVKFTIWPGQRNLVESDCRQQMVNAMKAIDLADADWRVTVTYRAMSAPHLESTPLQESKPARPTDLSVRH